MIICEREKERMGKIERMIKKEIKQGREGERKEGREEGRRLNENVNM